MISLKLEKHKLRILYPSNPAIWKPIQLIEILIGILINKMKLKLLMINMIKLLLIDKQILSSKKMQGWVHFQTIF